MDKIMGLRKLWSESLGDPRICIALLDGPVYRSHSALQGAQLNPIETLVRGIPNQGPASQHGTQVASIIFGQHNGPIEGIAPGCRGLIVPVFKDGPRGLIATASQIDIARAITQAVEHGAHVINLSGGEPAQSTIPHPLLANAVRLCVDNGVLIVASVGNEGCQCIHVPAASPSVLAVGAMNNNGLPLRFSNWGSAYMTQGILAPGENIPGAVPGGGVLPATGTSFATPIVSGIVALLLSIQLKHGEKPDPYAVRSAILRSAIRCEIHESVDCRKFLAGKLNIIGAYSIVKRQEIGVDVIKKEGKVKMDSTNCNKLECSDEVTKVLSSPESAMQGGGAPSLAYALGTIGYDFGTEARRDTFTQAMGEQTSPYDQDQMLAYLDEHPYESPRLIWTLNLDGTPIYAIRPTGPYAEVVYDRLRESLRAQMDEGVQRVSIPGFVAGQEQLLSGQVVPVIWPVVRGMYSWSTEALVGAVVGEAPNDESGKAGYEQRRGRMDNFLERVYYELRNLGLSPQERALNFAVTNVSQAGRALEDAAREGMELDSIEVEPSPVRRPGSDRWDVKLVFFDPGRRLERARRVYRLAVDVSDVISVTVGPIRSWSVY